MRRTQLYLDEDLWKALHIQSRQRRTSISDLVREAVRERYINATSERREAMQALVGIWSDRNDLGDTKKYLHRLRQGTRLRRIA